MKQLLTAEEAKNKTHNYKFRFATIKNTKNDIMNQAILILNDQILKACSKGVTSIIITNVEPSIREDLVTKLTELGYLTNSNYTKTDSWEINITW